MSDFDPTVYGTEISGEYDQLYEGYWDTEATVERLAVLADGGPVLELGIGTGRLSLPLVARGLEVHGVEGSPDMVAKLHEKPGGADIPVVVGDFADADVGRDFALVVLAVNTIFALPDQRSQLRCFANAARHLRPGGQFVIEAWVPDLGVFHRNRLVRPRVHQADRISIEVVELDQVNQMMRTTQAVFGDGGVKLYPANHRYAFPAELDLMAELAGMHLVERWADWTGAPFGPDSRDHVSLYRLGG